MFIDAPPNFERSGVVAGFILGPGSDLTPVLSRGVLFAQGAIYRPAAAPALPAAPAARQSWLFFNFQSGFYWAAAPVATAPDDALLGWALADAARVIAVSRQRIFVPDPKENITVIPLGPVLAQAAGGPSFGDTAPPPEPSFGTNASGRGVLEIAGLAFLTLENTRSIGSATFRIFYRDETGAASGDLAADVDAAAAIFPVSNGAGFSAGGLYLLDAEIVQVTAINGNNLSVARARL
ncbi:MAG: hypothetical protein FJW37_15050, partial [Acidobacteria bacterium]|nr:hypothetical protein [Acidobacteriota bacterium]